MHNTNYYCSTDYSGTHIIILSQCVYVCVHGVYAVVRYRTRRRQRATILCHRSNAFAVRFYFTILFHNRLFRTRVDVFGAADVLGAFRNYRDVSTNANESVTDDGERRCSGLRDNPRGDRTCALFLNIFVVVSFQSVALGKRLLPPEATETRPRGRGDRFGRGDQMDGTLVAAGRGRHQGGADHQDHGTCVFFDEPPRRWRRVFFFFLLRLGIDFFHTTPQEARNERVLTALNIDQALDARDAFAKALYSSLFTWLVARINHIVYKGTKKTTAISILDIFGFEDFKVTDDRRPGVTTKIHLGYVLPYPPTPFLG